MKAEPKRSTAAIDLSEEKIRSFRRDGFVHLPGVISREEAEEFRRAALEACRKMPKFSELAVFTQVLNLWRLDPTLKQLTLHPNIGPVAEQLVGKPMRLWHDHLLIKQPKNQKPTEFHQDSPYEPLSNIPSHLTAWVALCDVPVERGCMSFIPGAQHMTDLPTPKLEDPANFEIDEEYMFRICPDLRWYPRVTIPLRAGDCTFHRGSTPHRAGQNATTEPRVAHVIVFVDADAVYAGGKPHPVAEELGLRPGEPLGGEMFPAVREFAAIR
jgi:ectoine hydroxylase-related dioxygenase (phytanoyl-CoA dioxygenase family)